MDHPAPSSDFADEPATDRRAGTAGSRRGRSDGGLDRALRALVSTRPTQLTTSQALRAREFARPSAADLATAAAELVIVRRNYVPPAPLPPARKRGPSDTGVGGSGTPPRRQPVNRDAATRRER